MSSELSVLSISYTRELWDDRNDADRSRLAGYASQVGTYTVIVFSRKHHKLTQRTLANNFTAIPTNGFTPVDNWLRTVVLGIREFKKKRYDLIQAQDPSYSGLAAVLLGKLFRVPVNICVYGTNPFDIHFANSSWGQRILSIVGRYVLRRVDGIQVDGQLTEASLLQNGIPANRIARKSLFATDIADFQKIHKTTRSLPKGVRLLFVGRLAKQKDLLFLLESLARLSRSSPTSFELEIVGDGPEREAIAHAVAQLGLTGTVILSGSKNRSEVRDSYSKADIFVLSSRFEGFPRALLESALAGVPALTTRVSGADELVLDGVTGFIVPVGDTTAYSEKLRTLIEDPVLRHSFGLAARKHGAAVLQNASRLDQQLKIWEAVGARNRLNG